MTKSDWRQEQINKYKTAPKRKLSNDEYTARRSAYFDALGACGETTVDQYLAMEQSWQSKRIADALTAIAVDGIGD
jgi:hypothetical protein